MAIRSVLWAPDCQTLHLPEVEKFIAGLEAGVFEAYETLGMTLGSIVDQPNQSDIFMPIIFGLMPESAQRTMLADPRVSGEPDGSASAAAAPRITGRQTTLD